MSKRIAVLGIIVERLESAARVNELLHEYAPAIIGRMGVPIRERGVSVISVVVDAEQDQISALSGKLGRISGVSVKAAYAKGKERMEMDKEEPL